MLKAGSQLNLAPKAIEVDRSRHIGRKNLYDDLPLELDIGCDVHTRHARTSQLAIDAITGTEDFVQSCSQLRIQ
jgi:hypothetical protein